MWALIERGAVVELTDIDPTGRYHIALQWLECPPDTQTGWAYDGETFAPAQTHSPSLAELLLFVDAAADRARHKVAGDPLRAEEYKAAASEAAAFAAANYEGDVPPMVGAWVTPNRTAQQAADDIINEAAAYNAALVQLRTARLQAKEHIRALMAADDVEQARVVAAQTVAAIEQAVAGIGNNA